jgi:hypothetical protein
MLYLKKKSTAQLSVILFSIPFIQLGYEYYLSVMIFSFIVTFSLLGFKDFISSIKVIVCVLPVMFIPTVIYILSADVIHAILLTGRHFLCFAVGYIIISRRQQIAERLKPNTAVLQTSIVLLVVSLLVVVIIQYVLIRRGVLFFLPREFFILNYGTLPTELDLRWTNIRPSATFGEPSFLGFISVSLLLVCGQIFNNKWIKIFLFIGIWIMVLLANTVAGIGATFILTFLYLWKKNRSAIVKILLIISLISVISIGFIGQFGIFHRITHIAVKEKEASGYARIIVPLIMVSGVLKNSPFGVPVDELPRFLAQADLKARAEIGALSNGFFNLIINYGLGGVLIMLLVCYAVRHDLYLMIYIFLASMFNGGILTFDKISVIAVCVISMEIGKLQPRTQGIS